uniref:Conotoxin pc16a n=1 Tax=Conus pictus TaxID=1042615 RepID=CUGA_CONPB|nr:RecName: Full=Conotoxin pc16a; AltName: Full=pc16b [Conus pictus]2LER_A Chain A, Conotoxin pc16a [Conus pictus]
SCSCKRNFLCC